MFEIQKVIAAQIPAAAELATRLWPGHGVQEMTEELAQLIGNTNAVIFLACQDGLPIGFAQCQLRHDYVEGTDSSPVGYLEGVYVADGYRNHGIARALLCACEDWAREKGCTEFASDCELTNTESLRFHLHTGFDEANRIICFTKRL